MIRIIVVINLVLLGTYSAFSQDSLNVRSVGQCDTPGWAADVALYDTFALIADSYKGVRIISVGDPSNPVEIATIDTTYTILNVTVDGHYAYLTYPNDKMLKIINIINPKVPIQAGVVSWPSNPESSPHDITVRDGFAYVADRFYGLRIFDVSNTSAPQQICSCAVSDPLTSDLALYGNYAFVNAWTEGLFTIDISDNDSPYVANVYGSAMPLRSIKIDGHYAYIGADTTALCLFDIIDPLAPNLLGIYSAQIFTYGVDAKDQMAYIAASWSGLRVINCIDADSMFEQGYYSDPSCGMQQLTVANGYVYAANGNAGLRIYQYYGPVGVSGGEITASAVPGTAMRIYPNPFSETVKIRFNLKKESNVDLKIYDAAGRLVRSVYRGRAAAGYHAFDWQGEDIHGRKTSAGVYYVRLVAGGDTKTRKILRIK